MIARELCDLLEGEWTRLAIEWREAGSDPGDTRCFLISREATFWRKIWVSELPKVESKPLKRQYIYQCTRAGITYAYDTLEGREVYVSGVERD